ncbi:sensor histidine kinase [Gandjariella thermophila]|uniref:histidine kinase n=1 Tax=Gandjariella thermophila TaxID=1931992 RepID=A0A4D4J932_9PSEU|nr:nitrate- and nitrite sensing domain-containing protein [Gandjariella thermophila]GDY31006.1 histidine kinase [Gandjariella thermophila]
MLAIVSVPSVAMLVAGACLFGYLISDGLHVRGFAEDVRRALGPTTAFIASAEEERRLTLQSLSQPAQTRADLEEQRRRVDAALTDLSAANARLARDASADMRASLRAFNRASHRLNDVRHRVDNGQIDVPEAYAFYNDLLARCGATIQDIARSAASAQVGFEQLIAYNLFTAAEAMSRAHAIAVRAVSSGLDPDQMHELAHELGAYHGQLEALVPEMTQQEQGTYAALKTTPAWQQLAVDDEFVMNHDDDFQADHGRTRGMAVPFNTTDWENAAHQLSQGLMGLYVSHSTYAADLGTASGRRALVTSVLLGAGIVLLVAGVLVVAVRLSRRLIHRLTRLREETLDMADRRLPDLVRRLGEGESVDLETEVPWLDHGEDEIGQVAKAFNAAQRSAIAATAREAETREGVRAVFLNIAHRTQVIVHRQLKVLDQAQRSLEDPDQLQLLFQLDHLATRGRRNAENLIILGGGQAGRQWRNPVSVREVVRGAIAETEHYMRINTVRLPDVAVSGVAVADLVHLLAELLDNATSFSPPHSLIEVRGNAVGRGVVIEIEDQGLGIDPDHLERFNAMLQDPPDFSVMALSEEPRIGLFVVARLASRHGIKVTLRESASDGIRATVLLPTGILAGAATPAIPPAARPDARAAVAISPAPADERPAVRRRVPPPALEPALLPTLVREAPLGAGEYPVDGYSPAAVGAIPASRPAGASESGTASGSAGESADVSAADASRERPAESPDRAAEPDGAEVAGTPDEVGGATGVRGRVLDHLAPLPRRVRQRNLAPQLLANGSAAGGAQTGESSGRTAEHSRSRMAAFQQGTRRARAGEPEPTPARAEARVDEGDDGESQRR